MMGASNLWFPSTQSIIVMPRTDAEEKKRSPIGSASNSASNRNTAVRHEVTSSVPSPRHGTSTCPPSPTTTLAAVAEVLAPARLQKRCGRRSWLAWDPIELLVPEWRYLQKPSLFPQQQNASGLMVTEMQRGPSLHPHVARVVAVNQIKKVNAVLGFTRLDEMDRVNDLASRLVKLTRNGKPTWVPATEDRGEGIFLQLDLNAVASWERTILGSSLWAAHRQAHRRNFSRRFSETAKVVDPGTRLPAPRYWLLHTFAHTLIREMAMSCGYGVAVTERIYG